MLTVSEAQVIVLQQARPLPPETLPITAAAQGQVLAEDIISDLDMPPYDKALMDGFAVRTLDLPEGRATLHVIEEVTAGRTPQLPLGPGQATRIMTGAPLPDGADAVIMIERTRPLEKQRVQIEDRPPRPGQNIMPRGREMRQGQVVLPAGTLLRPQEFGVLASVGRVSAKLYPRPAVAILSTGDEVVDAPRKPGPGQIRNGNGPMLLAQAGRAGGLPRYLGIARDEVEHLRTLVDEGLQSPLFALSGGVSAGKLDLVPGVLRELGVQAHFHQVEMKPGRPVFFGTKGDCLVFGLPGNPVSALVCFELFVRPALRRLMSLADPGPCLIQAALTNDYTYRSDRPTYHPAKLTLTKEGWQVQAVPWFGSPDLTSVVQANAFLILPAGEQVHRAGQRYAVLKTDLE
jgi:molybdopterin molybdotransferase